MPLAAVAGGTKGRFFLSCTEQQQSGLDAATGIEGDFRAALEEMLASARAVVTALEAALAGHPYDREVLAALAAYEREAGRLDAARSRLQAVRELEPDNPARARDNTGRTP